MIKRSMVHNFWQELRFFVWLSASVIVLGTMDYDVAK